MSKPVLKLKKTRKTKKLNIAVSATPSALSPPGPLSAPQRVAVIAEVQGAASQSLAFLKARQAQVAAYSDFDVFVDREEDSDPRRGEAIEHHIVQLRAKLAAAIWKRQVFLSVDVIDRLIFDVVHHDGGQILEDFFEALYRHGVPSPGLVVYPLHSFGVLGFGLFTFLTKQHPDLIIKDASLAITPQTNDDTASADFLDRSAEALGLTRSIDRDDLRHYIRSRPLQWFKRNPLLVVAISSTTSGYYENQFIFMLKLRLSTALIMMLGVVGDQSDVDERYRAFSTARTNNWQTLDVKHYLVFEPSLRDRTRLTGRAVPMNAARIQLAELSDLNADIDPVAWSGKRATKKLDAIRTALQAIEAGYFEHHVLGDRKALKANIYRKLLDSVDYFRRSMSASADERQAVVALAIAFEALLMDEYAGGVTKRLHGRVKLALQGVKGVRKMRAAVVDLFRARGAVVHSGRTDVEVDLLTARRAYIACLIAVTGKLSSLPSKGERAIGRMLGEVVSPKPATTAKAARPRRPAAARPNPRRSRKAS